MSNDIKNTMTAYDSIYKQLFAEKDILSRIMKECVDEFKDCSLEDIANKYIEGTPQISSEEVFPTNPNKIRGLSNEDKSIGEGTVTYDIRFLATVPNTDGLIQLIVNVEAQNKYHIGYPLIKRALYYCSRMMSAQHGTEFTESHYEKIKKVYSIWICPNPPKKDSNTITSYSIQENNIVGNFKEEVKNYDLIKVVMVLLGKSQSDNNLLKFLRILLRNDMLIEEKQRILKEDFDYNISKNIEREVIDMCNLSMGIYEEGIEKGIAEGVEKTAINMLKKNMDIDTIMELTGLSKEKIEELKLKL